MSVAIDGDANADIITYLKTEARLLQKHADAGEQGAVLRLQANTPAVMVGSEIQRKHALATIAREIGFPSWKAVVDCFGEGEDGDFASFLHPKRCHIYWNIWLAHYEEAKKVRADHGGYLLSYAHQFLIVDDDFIRSLGVDPLDPRWEAIGRDWHEPRDPITRAELALKIAKAHLLIVRPKATAA